ncbi:MAG: nitronate monooxygenase [Candidatus Paceibacterota bacterium]
MISTKNPRVIQGGMGFYISTPFLANEVSRLGGLGTVSGVAPERVMAIKLQSGDVGGHFREALSHFPFPAIAQMVLDNFFIEEGNPRGLTKRGIPVFSIKPSRLLIALCVTANFAFVWLSRQGHENPVSINYLEKIALPHVYAIVGAMLGGVDYITMGAGIPLQIPALIDSVYEGRTVKYRIPVEGKNIKSYEMTFDPETFFGGKLPPMKKPRFLPIIASNLLASILVKKLPRGSIYGFVIEEPSAGGHNAQPRKGGAYGPKDEVDYAEIVKHGLPFWIGGSKASPEKLRWALSIGAEGIQVGTALALCEKSGMSPRWRTLVRKLGYRGTLRVKTDFTASPAGFPFKVGVIPNTLSETDIYTSRERSCAHGVLVTLFERSDGSIGCRCPGEPVEAYVHKGGAESDTVDRRCLCSGLIATTGLGNEDEAPIITLGDDITRLMPLLMRHEDDTYGVADVFKYLGVL